MQGHLIRQSVSIFTAQSGLFGFSPQALTVPAAMTVTCKNPTQVAHTVTSEDGASFDSGIVPAGGTVRFTFKKAGCLSL